MISIHDCFILYQLGNLALPRLLKLLPPFTRTGIYRENKFSLLKLTHSCQNLNTQTRKFLWVSRVPQSKFEAKRSRGFLRYDRTNKQTDGQTEITTLYIQITVFPNIISMLPNIISMLPNIITMLANSISMLPYIISLLPNIISM